MKPCLDLGLGRGLSIISAEVIAMLPQKPVRLALYAMATRFELVLNGHDDARLRAAGEEAISEIERVERQISFYDRNSELSRLNRQASEYPVIIDPRLFSLVQRCVELNTRTRGAFDVSVAPLMRAWGFAGGAGRIPNTSTLHRERAKVGMGHLILNEREHTISFDRDGVEIDLGGVGKGYAIERAVQILRESGIGSGLIHGGTSTIYGIGCPPESNSWQIGIRNPLNESVISVSLRDRALSVSAIHGKSFADGSREYGHVIDPRTGLAAQGALLAVVLGPSPTECDALSTGLLVLGEDGLAVLADEFPACSGLVILPNGELASAGDAW